MRIGHWAPHQSQAVSVGWPDCLSDPAFEVRAEHEQPHDERRSQHESDDDRERDEPLADELPAVLAVVGHRQPVHQGCRRGGRRPDRQCEAEGRHRDAAPRGLGRSAKAVLAGASPLLRALPPAPGRSATRWRSHLQRARRRRARRAGWPGWRGTASTQGPARPSARRRPESLSPPAEAPSNETHATMSTPERRVRCRCSWW